MNSEERFAGLDSIRGLAAVWVAIAHGASFPARETLVWLGLSQSLLPNSLNSFPFNSTAAVTVFFVVSGFCIHRPYVDGRCLQLLPYLTRRLIRVGVPMVTVLIFVSFVGGIIEGKSDAVLWTVYCELIYYGLYPFILLAARRIGMMSVLGISIALSLVVIAFNFSITHPGFIPGGLSWVVCLPFWLTGCVLAEKFNLGSGNRPAFSIWLWRGGTWGLSVLALWGVFHSPIRIGYPTSMLVFAVLAAMWLERELARYAIKKPVWILEHLGSVSYSIYLVHMIVLGAFASVDWSGLFMVEWLAKVAAILGLSMLFYVLVERPSHNLARSLSNRFRAMRPVSA